MKSTWKHSQNAGDSMCTQSPAAVSGLLLSNVEMRETSIIPRGSSDWGQGLGVWGRIELVIRKSTHMTCFQTLVKQCEIFFLIFFFAASFWVTWELIVSGWFTMSSVSVTCSKSNRPCNGAILGLFSTGQFIIVDQLRSSLKLVFRYLGYSSDQTLWKVIAKF